MDILTTPSDMQEWRRAHPGGLGFVPTMGYLHEGHMALVRRARAENDLTAVSIFVNPTQFGPNEDFEKYPRDEERDLALLREAGVHAVYLPPPAAMYPPGYQTYVTVEQVSRHLEGERRPGHFRGVATVVLKLFNAVSPTRAYFGRKDAQQLRVLQRMTRDLDLPVEIVPCDIVREPDGLAMSSRNVYLSPEQRAAAPVIYAALQKAKAAFQAGERGADALRGLVRSVIETQPLADIDYISLAADETLDELEGELTGPALLSVVVRFGATRLLDNVELG
ncbi:MAG: pantoate--beta-alanine ligase [Hyphomicrobiales bacterium]